MENWHKRLLLGAIAYCATAAWAIAEEGPIQVIEPEVERREIGTAAIDTENFEVGPYIGALSIQDFNTEVLFGLRGSWHITEDFFFEASYGNSDEIGRAHV